MLVVSVHIRFQRLYLLLSDAGSALSCGGTIFRFDHFTVELVRPTYQLLSRHSKQVQISLVLFDFVQSRLKLIYNRQ